MEIEVSIRIKRNKRNQFLNLLPTCYLYNNTELENFLRRSREQLATIRNSILDART